MVNINYEIPDELHKQIKLKAMQEGLSLKEWIINTFNKEIETLILKNSKGASQ